ncbi:MAG: hypothetical protein EBU90_26355 [Proteobacteria bacterium]|nr:hypothetical protein [Pseudomonadota bacterium]
MKKFDIKWIATAMFIFGGTIVSLKLPWMQYAFPGFVIAHSVLLYDFMKTHKNKPLVIQNAYFFVMNLVATFIWFGDIK